MNSANAAALRNLIAQRDALKGRPLTAQERRTAAELTRRINTLTAIMATT